MSAMDSWENGFELPVDRIAENLENISRDHGGGPVEAFVRDSVVTKIELDGATGETRERVGREQGGALRWMDTRDGTSGFAAASGGGPRALSRCAAISHRTPGETVTSCPWNEHAEPVEDLVSPSKFPENKEIEAWLRDAIPVALDWSWVMVGEVLEAWLTGPETVQVRRRRRAWAAWMPLADPPSPRPMFLAARGWNDLTRRDPAAAWAERNHDAHPEHPWPDDAQLVFSPETSAALVHLLARVVHHPEARPGAAVGPGWVLNTGSGDALHGAVNDDAGFPVVSRVLADGRHAIGHWGGRGQYRRPSFRDLPEVQPSSLRMEPPSIDPPKRAVWITRVDIHPSGDGWSVQLSGRRYPDGAGLRPCWKRLSPARIIDACMGGVGPVHESHLGVVTPALMFDGLLLDQGRF